MDVLERGFDVHIRASAIRIFLRCQDVAPTGVVSPPARSPEFPTGQWIRFTNLPDVAAEWRQVSPRGTTFAG